MNYGQWLMFVRESINSERQKKKLQLKKDEVGGIFLVLMPCDT